jgi:hypothetical protein
MVPRSCCLRRKKHDGFRNDENDAICVGVGLTLRSTNGRPRLLVVMQQAEDVVLFEALAAAEEVEFNGEGEAGDFAA